VGKNIKNVAANKRIFPGLKICTRRPALPQGIPRILFQDGLTDQDKLFQINPE
jgi:hypothetical protein